MFSAAAWFWSTTTPAGTQVLSWAGSLQQNYQCQLELTKKQQFPKPSSTCKVLCIHLSEGKGADAVCAGVVSMLELQHILCHIPGSLGLTEDFGASLLCPLTPPAAGGSWRMMCWHLVACWLFGREEKYWCCFYLYLSLLKANIAFFPFKSKTPQRSLRFPFPIKTTRNPATHA